MKPSLFCLFLVVVFISPAGAATPPLSRPLTLKDAVSLALENSPLFDSARKTQSIRDLEYKNAVAKMLPSLDFSSTHGLQNNIPINGANNLLTRNPAAPWYSSLSLGLTEALYDNGVSLTNARVASLNRDLSSVQFLKARDTLTLAVATEFHRYSLAVALFEVRKQQESLLEKQFKTLSNQYEQGLKTKSDYLRLKTQVQRAEIERITAQNSFELSATELRKLLGTGGDSANPVTFQPVPVTRDQKINESVPVRIPDLETTYDYRISKIQEEINGKSVTLAKRNYYPRVLVTSGITYSNSNYLNSGTPFNTNNDLSWSALLTLQYNFWDWGARRREVAIAEYNRDIQQNSLNQTLLETNAQMTRLMFDLSRLNRNYRLSQELLSMEEESNHNLEIQYREGKVTYLDLITGLNNLLDAKVQFYTSYFEMLQGLAKYRYFEGKVYETVLQK